MIYGAILEDGLEFFTCFKEIFHSLDNFQKNVTVQNHEQLRLSP